MRLHLIRHGQTHWNAIRRVQGHSESELNENGQQQALSLSSTLDSLPLGAVYCSSSRRTRQTAELLFARRPLPIVYLDSLREIYLGPWEGRLYDEIQQEDAEQFHNFWHAPHQFRVEGAESYHELQQRGVAAIKDICAANDHGEIAVVSHGALIKSVLTHFERKPLERLWDPPLMHNCSHSILELDGDGDGHILKYA